jgi:hypothetical protein
MIFKRVNTNKDHKPIFERRVDCKDVPFNYRKVPSQTDAKEAHGVNADEKKQAEINT